MLQSYRTYKEPTTKMVLVVEVEGVGSHPPDIHQYLGSILLTVTASTKALCKYIRALIFPY